MLSQADMAHSLLSRICLYGFLALAALVAPAEAASNSQDTMFPTQDLPREFEAHFFDVPLAVRVDLDGRYLGDAMVVLSRDQRVQLLEFTDTQESLEPAALRRRWQERLEQGRPLGDCLVDCVDGLRAVHYSLVNSQLSLLTHGVEQNAEAVRYHALPEQGSYGVLLRNQLNVLSSDHDISGRYALQGQGSVGNWTVLADAQADRGSDAQARTRHRLDQLYGERIVDDHFYRLGYFTPGAQGLVRQPRLYGASADTALGLMFGSSESLLVETGQASATPIYVTPNRPGIVEIYRNGVLVNSQAVQPGLQALNTRVLPSGIYEVEVRLVEDGQETSRSEAFVYKPSNWSNHDKPWRYNAYVGQQQALLSNWDDDRERSLTAGLMGNYLLHPRAILGVSAQQLDERMQYGTSLDWNLHDRLKLYGNYYQSQGRGDGYDLQALYDHDRGSLVFSHTRSRVDTASGVRRPLASNDDVRQTSLSYNHRVNARSTASLRLTQSTGAANGSGVDLGWAFYGKVLGSDANWRFSVFDRPGTQSTGEARNRGVNVSLSMSLGGPGKRIGASLGTRTSRDGGRDQNASVFYQQQVELGALHTLGGTVTFDRYGNGVSGNAQFQNQSLDGDVYAQQSSYNGEVSTGLNLQSLVAVGAGKVALSGQHQPQEAGLIIDVDSDLPELSLRADDVHGMNATLKPGRNVVPVTAYRSGHVQFDFVDAHDPSAVIQPTSLDYHLNRGGVEYRQIRVLRTVTVLGRLLDRQGEPLSGAMVINHASRGVSEAGGHFAVQLSQATPTLEIRHAGQTLCNVRLDLERYSQEDDVVLLGDLACVRDGLAGLPVGKVGGKVGG